jgi:uncharacterized protein (DUF58 family)
MLGNFLFLLLFMLVVAILVKDDIVFTILYLVAGSLFLGRLWSRRSLSQLTIQRRYENRVFTGEKVPITVIVKNKGRLPLLWLMLRETTPANLRESPPVNRVISLGGKSEEHMEYSLQARKRGYYPVGPLHFTTGDILGITNDRSQEQSVDTLIVYPRVLPLGNTILPSRLPMGNIRYSQPIFEDMTRPVGKRDYVSGDSIRRIDWKTSAVVGNLQVKTFEPAIGIEAAIFLNLNIQDYDMSDRFEATELAIVAAASLANHVQGLKQPVGLWTNGFDPMSPDGISQPLPVNKSRNQLMQILEVLARIKLSYDVPFPTFVQQNRFKLSWGTTLVIISGSLTDQLLDELYLAHQSGIEILCLLCGTFPVSKEMQNKAHLLGIHTLTARDEGDLKAWR